MWQAVADLHEASFTETSALEAAIAHHVPRPPAVSARRSASRA
jgi:hypothetical protein